MSQRNLSPSQFKFLLATTKVASADGMKMPPDAYKNDPKTMTWLSGESGGHQRVLGELHEPAFGYDGAKGAELS